MPFLVVAIYAVVGGAWVFVFDLLLERWPGPLAAVPAVWFETLEGVARVAIISTILFLVVRRVTTALARSKAELAEISVRLSLLMRGVREYALVNLSPEGIVLSWNPGAQRIKGYEADEIIGRHFSCFYAPEDQEAGEPARHLREAAADGECLYEGWRVRRDGTRFWASIVLTALRDEAGLLQGYAKITRDLSERRRAGEALRSAHERLQRQAEDLERLVAERTAELRESNEDLQTFAHMTSHDLRAPLRAMQGFAQALLEDHSGSLDATGLDYARRIVSSAARMDTLIRDLLTYHRLARSELQAEDLQGDLVLEDAIAALGDTLRQRGALVEAERPLPLLRGHRGTLAQILANLLDNASKYVAPGVAPRVKVRAERRPGRVRLWVEDNGVGIPAEHRERVFQPFERLHGVEAYSGSGIGLALVHKGAERMGGAAGVESEPGRGSRFWIEVPAPHPAALKEAV